MEQRDKDILRLCKQVIDMSPDYWDNPNGGIEHRCPLCYEYLITGSMHNNISMSDIEHKSDCAYLIAKDLSTNLI